MSRRRGTVDSKPEFSVCRLFFRFNSPLLCKKYTWKEKRMETGGGGGRLPGTRIFTTDVADVIAPPENQDTVFLIFFEQSPC